MSKWQYTNNGSVLIGDTVWDVEGLKQLCYSDFVYAGKNRGVICNKYKIPRELLNEFVESEDWEFDKKSFWQRPYSYRIDDALQHLLNNVVKLDDIQKEVDDIETDPKNLISRIKIDMEVKSEGEFQTYKTFILEKYIVKVFDYEEFTGERIDYDDEIRYRVNSTENQVLIQSLKYKKKL